jgi:hypothetical protein
MYRTTVLLFLIFQVFAVFATNKRSDSLLLVLDNTIKEKSLYAKKREHKIDSLRSLLNFDLTLEQQYDVYQKLYELYRHYSMNSALSMSEKQALIAKELKNQRLLNRAKMNSAEVMGIMGMYKESLDIINNIDYKQLDSNQYNSYYHAYHSLYLLMFGNTLSPREKEQYKQYISLYKDSILQTIEVNTLGYDYVKNGKLIEQGRADEALSQMKQCYQTYGNDNTQLGTLAYIMSEIYAQKKDLENEKRYLAISATADLKLSVKEYISLRKLAMLLYQEGDIYRAYNYIECSMEDAAFCGAHFRILEISGTLPIINAAYSQKMKQEKKKLIKYLILISILSIVLVASIIFIWRQMKKLSSAKKSIQNMYEDLKQMNKDLDELNKKLSESNRVKEEYIGLIFNLCLKYINKMETYRIYINKKIVSNHADDIKKITSSSLVADELKEFFSNFDTIFLSIYPKFIDDFNALLTDGERIVPKAGEILTPELRVYALIRLGITNNNKIADFLHYSPQTVYNYKIRIKNRLVVSKDEFYIAIRKIGI